jgi:hypothetical protein
MINHGEGDNIYGNTKREKRKRMVEGKRVGEWERGSSVPLNTRPPCQTKYTK